jgi:hypothetical protein
MQSRKQTRSLEPLGDEDSYDSVVESSSNGLPDLLFWLPISLTIIGGARGLQQGFTKNNCVKTIVHRRPSLSRGDNPASIDCDDT